MINTQEEYVDKLTEKVEFQKRGYPGSPNEGCQQIYDAVVAEIEDYERRRRGLHVGKTEARRCPFCPSEDLRLLFDRQRGHFVSCKKCLGSGPYSEHKEDAIRLWNVRA